MAYIKLLTENRRILKQLYPNLDRIQRSLLLSSSAELRLSLLRGEITILEGKVYVTHAGLLRIARRRRCSGIRVGLDLDRSNGRVGRWVFKATVSQSGSEFEGYGDADPSNVSPTLRGAELRIAETRAVNRALRKAYGIGICSVEELGASNAADLGNTWKVPPQSASGKVNQGPPKLRDRLCELIRQHGLDANLVKSYAIDFCGTQTLRQATREQVEAFVAHLADWVVKDRNALLCQLNSYLPPQTETTEAGAA